eukprot:jgi/Hompol1/3608/HPOL_003301-RA
MLTDTIVRVKYFIDDLDEPVVFERAKFVKLQAVQNVTQFREKHEILHWDPLTGLKFEIGRGSKFPFDRLVTIFNHSNMYMNVQPIDMSTHLLKDLAILIQLYRRHILFIPFTTFHRAASAHIQKVLKTHDDVLPIGSSKLPRNTGMASAANNGSSGAPITTSNSDPIDLGSYSSFRQKRHNGADNIISKLKKSIVPILPDRHYWYGNMFQFMDCDPDGILEQLVSTGILDVSIPDAMLTIGVRVILQPFGMFTVRVVMGYVADLLALEQHKFGR